ncbi:MAG: translation initiation factor IF-1 [Deltaproteobacteria bacterium]|nr:translation initiation factor IF-1 [Deltaproteobacteria bacterium]
MSDGTTGLIVAGRVTDVLPRGLFAVRTENGPVTAGMGREAAHVVRVKPGDEVEVRLSPRDPTRGRIVGRTR